MTASELRRGIQILTSYFEDNEPMPMSAEHDKLWLGGEALRLTAPHIKELQALGFEASDLGWMVNL